MTAEIRKYAFIDALRGYAILLVIISHSWQAIGPLNPTLKLLMSNGGRGVQLFFIASALTLCLSWQFRNQLEQSPVRNFFLRRFFRIAPLFYVAIVFFVLLYGLSPRYWAPNGVEWWFVPLTALFLHGFLPETINTVVPGGWSIAVEMSFYLVLPLVFSHIKTIKSAVYFFIFSLCIYGFSKLSFEQILVGLYPANQQYLVDDFIFFNFLSQLPVFALGLLAYFVFCNFALLKRIVIIGNFLLLLFVAALLQLPSEIVIRLLTHHIVIGLILTLASLTLAIFPVKIFVNRAATQIGKISFSMYLTHFAVIYFFSILGIKALFKSGDISSILYFLCVVTVSAFISYFLYATIERSGILLGKRVIEKLEKRDVKIKKIGV